VSNERLGPRALVPGTPEYWKNREIELLAEILTGPLSETGVKLKQLIYRHVQIEKENEDLRLQAKRDHERSMAKDRVISRLRTVCLANGMDAIDHVIKSEWDGEEISRQRP